MDGYQRLARAVLSQAMRDLGNTTARMPKERNDGRRSYERPTVQSDANRFFVEKDELFRHWVLQAGFNPDKLDLS